MLVNITPFTRKSKAPPGFHMLAEPTGAACNLDCKYCFFLSKDMLYPKDPLRMSDEMLEVYIKQTPVTWQRKEIQTMPRRGGHKLTALQNGRRGANPKTDAAWGIEGNKHERHSASDD